MDFPLRYRWTFKISSEIRKKWQIGLFLYHVKRYDIKQLWQEFHTRSCHHEDNVISFIQEKKYLLQIYQKKISI